MFEVYLMFLFGALDHRRVRVRGSRFEPARKYTVKLEGAEQVGYQSIVMAHP